MDLSNYAKLTPEASARQIFASYSYTRALPPERIEELIAAGIGIGNELAQTVKTRHPGLAPSEIAAECGVAVSYERSEKNNARFVKFAEYHAKSKQIHLNGNVIDFLDRIWPEARAGEVIIAHELFHYYEMTEIELVSRRFSFERKLLGLIPIKHNLLPVSEIAANAFCKNLADLSFEPKLLETVYFDRIAAQGGSGD